MSTLLAAWGIETDLPTGWEGRISRRIPPHAITDQLASDDREPRIAAPLRNGAPVAHDDFAEEVMNPVVHMGNFPLPAARGDFGSGAVELMSSQNALVVLFEYGPECVGTALFAARGLPQVLDDARFSPAALQRRIPGQLGFQRFFTEADRAFCLYVVLGSQRHAKSLCAQSSETLASTRISTR